MTVSLQIFVYNTRKGIDESNNFPLLRFGSIEAAHEFVTKLKSSRLRDISGGFFALNNPQHMPISVRQLHMYPENNEDEDEPKMVDGYFSVEDADNIRLLKQCSISNNTLQTHGFREYMNGL